MSRIILILLLSLSALCFAADLPSAAIPQFHLQDTQPPCIPSYTNKLDFADFDGDGDLDCLCANFGEIPSQIWFNDGEAHFTRGVQTLMSGAHGLALADFNGDSSVDIALAGGRFTKEDTQKSQSTRLYINDGNGTFGQGLACFDDAHKACTGLASVDANGDGAMDLALTFHDPKVDIPNEMWLNDGSGHFSRCDMHFANGTLWADLTGDHLPDAVTLVPGTGIQIYRNTGALHLALHSTYHDTTMQRGHMDAADVDLDGDIDILFCSGSRSVTLHTTILLNRSDGTLTQSSSMPPLIMGKVKLQDINGDRYPDACLVGLGTTGEIWLNDGLGGFYDSTIRLPYSGLITGIATADLNNDGLIDLGFACFRGGANAFYIQYD